MQLLRVAPNNAIQCDIHAFGAAAPELGRWTTRVARLTLPAGERREIIDATGEGFCMYPETMIVAPSVSARKWTKMKIIDLYNTRRPTEAPELRATSLGNRSLAQVVSEAVELLAQQDTERSARR